MASNESDEDDEEQSERLERRREWLEERRTRRERNSFSREERERILKMLEEHERTRWVWSSIALAAKWISSVAAGTAIVIAAVKWGFGELSKWWS